MPIYEYRCLACGHQFELMQKFSDPPAKTCDVCSGEVQKLISRSAFHLKGGGWYVTDYGRNGSSQDSGKKDKNSTETGSSSESSSTSSTSSETSTPSSSGTSTKTETAAV